MFYQPFLAIMYPRFYIMIETIVIYNIEPKYIKCEFNSTLFYCNENSIIVLWIFNIKGTNHVTLYGRFNWTIEMTFLSLKITSLDKFIFFLMIKTHYIILIFFNLSFKITKISAIMISKNPHARRTLDASIFLIIMYYQIIWGVFNIDSLLHKIIHIFDIRTSLVLI